MIEITKITNWMIEITKITKITKNYLINFMVIYYKTD